MHYRANGLQQIVDTIEQISKGSVFGCNGWVYNAVVQQVTAGLG